LPKIDDEFAKKVSEYILHCSLLYLSIVFLVWYLYSMGCKALRIKGCVVALTVSRVTVFGTVQLRANCLFVRKRLQLLVRNSSNVLELYTLTIMSSAVS